MLTSSCGMETFTSIAPAWASMTLVLATSRGVVTAAEVPPAMAPHTALCQGSTGEPWWELQVDCVRGKDEWVTTKFILTDHMIQEDNCLVGDLTINLQALPQLLLIRGGVWGSSLVKKFNSWVSGTGHIPRLVEKLWNETRVKRKPVKWFIVAVSIKFNAYPPSPSFLLFGFYLLSAI